MKTERNDGETSEELVKKVAAIALEAVLGRPRGGSEGEQAAHFSFALAKIAEVLGLAAPAPRERAYKAEGGVSAGGGAGEAARAQRGVLAGLARRAEGLKRR